MSSDPVARYFQTRGALRERRGRLRPMTSAECVDAAARVFQTIGWSLLRATLPGALLIFCVSAYVFEFVLPEFLGINSTRTFEQQLATAGVNLALTAFVALPLSLVGVSITAATAAQTTYDLIMGNVPDPWRALKKAFQAVPRMFGIILVVTLLSSLGLLFAGGMMLAGGVLTSRSAGDMAGGFLVLFGFLAAAGGGIWMLYCFSRYALTPQIALLEGGTVRDILARSKDLMQARPLHGSGYGPIWTVIIVVVIVQLALAVGFSATYEILQTRNWLEGQMGGAPFAPIVLTAHDLLPSFLEAWILIPFGCVATTLIYIDRRVRFEGLDILMLAQDAQRRQREVRFDL